MAHCIPTYMMASGLIKAGMNWWQALVTILLGNVIVLVPILANSHPGTRYGIPFPVFARAAYGVFGANVPAIMRALVACGWFGIQCWIGGHALFRFFDCLGFGFADDLRRRARLRLPPVRVALLPALLGGQHPHHLPRHGAPAPARELGGAVRAGHDARARRLGGAAGGGSGARPRRPVLRPGEVPDMGSFLARLRPERDGDGRLLGDPLPQHARLHALRPLAAGADRSARWWPADDDDALRRSWGSSSRARRRRSSARRSGTRSTSAAKFDVALGRRARASSPPSSRRWR